MGIILVVEDDEQFRKLLKNFLTVAGHSVVTASSVEDAQRVVRDIENLDLALIDFWLEKEDAVSVFDILQSRHPDIPFVMMSGGAGSFPIESSDAVAKISGASAFLQKPFRRKELLATVERLLEPGVGRST